MARLTESARRDLGLLFCVRFARAVGFGFSTVLIGVYLQGRGLSTPQIGIVIAVGFAAAAVTGLLSAKAEEKVGRRVTLACTGLLMAVCGSSLVFAGQYWVFLAAALTGMLGVAGTDTGPFLAIEQAILTAATTQVGRNRAFGRYSVTGAIASAAGGLLASIGSDATRVRSLFVLYAAIGLVVGVLPLLLTAKIEGERGAPAFGNLRPLIRLSILFGIDSFGSGLVARSILVYWLYLKFGAGPTISGPTFAAMQLLGALGFEAAGRLADRYGLINTMVFTHLPSNLLLLLFPFLPALWMSITLLIIWSAAQSMDIPARQAYIVGIVKPNERSGAVAVTGLVRGLTSAAGPAITGAALQTAALGTPFLIAGTVKALYDVAIYVGFRRRDVVHESSTPL